MKCPKGKQPCTIDHEGNESPLFLPPAAVEKAREMWPTLWIEPTPMIPESGDLEAVDGFASF